MFLGRNAIHILTLGVTIESSEPKVIDSSGWTNRRRRGTGGAVWVNRPSRKKVRKPSPQRMPDVRSEDDYRRLIVDHRDRSELAIKT
jgi:hypothetical protein